MRTFPQIRSSAVLASAALLVLFPLGAACGSSGDSVPSGDTVAASTSGPGGATGTGVTTGTAATTGAGGAKGTSTTTAGTGGAASSTGSAGGTQVGVGGSAAGVGGGQGNAPRGITVTNKCAQTVWASALPSTTLPSKEVELTTGQSITVGVQNGWSGRVWGRAECVMNSGKLTCATDPFPSSLAEFTFSQMVGGGLDFYDVSLVDGFNLPIGIVAVGQVQNPAKMYDCGNPTCAPDLDATCPSVLQDKDMNQKVVACANDECKVLGMNDPTNANCIYPNMYTKFFKTACPTSYSFPTDDPTSTFTCKGNEDYEVVFCP